MEKERTSEIKEIDAFEITLTDAAVMEIRIPKRWSKEQREALIHIVENFYSTVFLE